MKYVSPSIREQWHPDNSGRGRLPLDARRTYHESTNERLQIVKALYDGGCGLLVGTDTPVPYVIPGFSLHDELRLFVQAGLSPFEAIKAGTRNAAECLGERDKFGSIAPGQRADLLLLEANPLDDVSNAAKRVGVMARGRWYPQAELQAKLDALADRYAAEENATEESIVFVLAGVE